MDSTRDWRFLGSGASAWFDAPSMSAGAALVRRITTAQPDVDLRPGGLRVHLLQPDAELANSISAAAHELGLTADPSILQTMRLVIDSANPSSLMPFWQTVLGDPILSFRPTPSTPLSDRLHIDVVRTPDAVSAARAAIGQEPTGPYGVALTDTEGNVVDLVPGDRLTKDPSTADWQVLFAAMTYYSVGSPEKAAELASVVAGLADSAGLPLMVDIRPDGVTIDSGKDQWENGEGNARSDFVDLAARIQSAARDLKLTADLTRPRFIQLGLAAVDVPAVRAFWTAVLSYQPDPRQFLTDIFDPNRLNPVMFFQQTENHQHRNRIHIELLVPHDQATPRVEAAIAAGGRLITESTPSRHSLTDPEGNELDIVTFPQP
ncbi:hypothetical protein JIG36_02290 [Actinoplanes sp. LDG1-06]|uniref:Glyoxalase-like domain-containing protein n=1 Tax=Paractinoplanes ovalisporus TaxID=2810368 RepID=A0ABS2A3F7_9ACTN|nr:VOC family protein [Actinoplanes ovalisporus]MBM2614386.1 hypothetical protein [Actinoplanes ovalisporus]